MFRFLVRLGLFLIVTAVCGEVVFRTILPANQAPFQAQNTEYGILHHERRPTAEGQFTFGRLAEGRTRWRINHRGWNCDRDYQRPTDRKNACVAVIGDSYTEGFYVDVDQGLVATLDRNLGPRCDVYNFGKSGVAMSQAIRVARYAMAEFRPDVLVFIMTHGSLSGSLRDHKPSIANAQLAWDDGELVELPPSVYHPNRLLRMYAYSALVRYLYQNAGLIKGAGAIRQAAFETRHQNVGLDRAEIDRDYAAAADWIVRTLREEHPDTPLLFVLDANRQAIYKGESDPDPHGASRFWQAACRQYDGGLIDLTDPFTADYQQHGERFNFEDNYHWNQRGMTIVAEAIQDWLTARSLP